MKNRILNTFCAFLIAGITQLGAQCAAGAYTVNPASATAIACAGAGICDGGMATVAGLPAGTQVCVILPSSGTYTFQTCGLTGDDTMITIFDNASTPIANNDDACGLQSSTTVTGVAGDVVCIQIETFFCDDTGSDSPTYDVSIICPLAPATLDCAVADFSEMQMIPDGSVMSAGNVFNFATGSGPFSSGIAILCAAGDLDGPSTASDEAWTFTSETGALCAVGNTGNLADQCSGTPICITIALTGADLDTWASDGTITLTADDLTGDINIATLCGAGETFITAELQLCAGDVEVPTLGEWGIILLSLFFVALGFVFIYTSRKTSLAK